MSGLLSPAISLAQGLSHNAVGNCHLAFVPVGHNEDRRAFQRRECINQRLRPARTAEPLSRDPFQPSLRDKVRGPRVELARGIRSIKGIVSLLVFLVFTATVCFAASPAPDPASTFDSANKLYAQGKFSDAASAYEKLISSGAVAPAVYYNLGNSLYKAGEIGRAIVAYRQAERLTPHDPDLRANLQFARQQVQGPTFEASRWELWLGVLTLNEWTWAGVLAVWITFLLLAARQLWPKAKRSLRNWAILSGATALAVVGCLGCALAHRNAVHIGVVTAKETEVRTGPFDESPGVFTAHDGSELRVLDQKNGWLQVTDGKSRVGWLKSDEVTLEQPA